MPGVDLGVGAGAGGGGGGGGGGAGRQGSFDRSSRNKRPTHRTLGPKQTEEEKV